MSIKGGYFRKGLHIDLGTSNADSWDISDSFIEKYIGGRGFGAKLVWVNLRKHDFKVNALGPENLMVVAPGPLTGIYLPSSGKCSFIAISPATGLYGDSSVGGGFGITTGCLFGQRSPMPREPRRSWWLPGRELPYAGCPERRDVQMRFATGSCIARRDTVEAAQRTRAEQTR